MFLDMTRVEIEVETAMPLIPQEPDDYLFKYDIRATYPSGDSSGCEQRDTIAFARVLLMESACFEDYSLLAASDAHSQETLELYEIFFERDNILSITPLDSVHINEIWYLEKFAIDTEYQNLGLGAAIIDWIVKYLCRCKGIMVVRPKPLTIKRMCNQRISIEVNHFPSPELQRMLVKFYERKGFEKLLTSPYMYRVAKGRN